MLTIAQGRTLPVTKTAKHVAEFSFRELCQEARSSSDYQAIGERFNSIILRDVPRMTMKRRDYMRRFINLIDTLYYMHRNIVIDA